MTYPNDTSNGWNNDYGQPYQQLIPAYQYNKDRKMISMILCFLGLVLVAGLHRFYVGKIWTGVLWLLTAGLFGIGTIVDFVFLCMGKFKDKEGHYI